MEKTLEKKPVLYPKVFKSIGIVMGVIGVYLFVSMMPKLHYLFDVDKNFLAVYIGITFNILVFYIAYELIFKTTFYSINCLIGFLSILIIIILTWIPLSPGFGIFEDYYAPLLFLVSVILSLLNYFFLMYLSKKYIVVD